MYNRKVKRRLFTRRAFILAGIKASLFFSLLVRLYYLQILKEKEYKDIADNNRIRLALIPPLRGKILDRDGRIFAENQDYYRILYDPMSRANVSKLVDKLTYLLVLSDEEAKIMLRKIQNYSARRPLIIYERLTWEQLSRIEFNIIDLPGITVEVGQMRYFPMKDKSPHFIGYLGAVSKAEISKNPLLNHPDFKVGVGGVEQYYDSILRGKIGIKRVEVNAFGVPVGELSRDHSSPGEDISLTIDKRLQEFLSQRLGDESASSVVMNIKTGEILAMASTPSFDPNRFTYGMSSTDWSGLLNDERKPLLNKALVNQYPPGSTFKTIVAIAGLLQGIDPNQTVFCPGYIVLGGRAFHCWKKEGHGHVDMVNAIKGSCNCYFFTVAKKIGIDNIHDMAKKFGLGQLYNISIPDQKAGRIPNGEWKEDYIGIPWQMGDTLNAGIGQGYVLANAMQLAVATSRLASGKMVIPYLAKKVGGNFLASREFTSLDIAEGYFDIVREGMRRVVNEPGGTAYASRIDDASFIMAGKSGTAQVVSRRYSDKDFAALSPELRKKLLNHALFIAYAPFHDPKYAISIIVEHGGGGSHAAAPIAKDVLNQTKLLNIT